VKPSRPAGVTVLLSDFGKRERREAEESCVGADALTTPAILLCAHALGMPAILVIALHLHTVGWSS
jgi:hypothetical protein